MATVMPFVLQLPTSAKEKIERDHIISLLVFLLVIINFVDFFK